MGPKNRILFEIITTNNCISKFQHLYKKIEISRLWACCWSIFKILRSEKNYTLHFVRTKCKEFLDLFLSVYQTSKITPYIHILCFHIPDLYEKYGCLNYFSGQGLEKLNDITTSQFFRATNKKGDFIKQLLERDHRMLDYEKRNFF